VKDLKAAERFYENALRLRKVDSEPGTASIYESGNTRLCVYRSEFAGTNKGTAAMWVVDDVDGTVRELKEKGVVFEHYDLPGLERTGDIHRGGPIDGGVVQGSGREHSLRPERSVPPDVG
jgi:hypothetical protein